MAPKIISNRESGFNSSDLYNSNTALEREDKNIEIKHESREAKTLLASGEDHLDRNGNVVDDVQKESEPPKARLSTLQDDVVSGAKEQDEELASQPAAIDATSDELRRSSGDEDGNIGSDETERDAGSVTAESDTTIKVDLFHEEPASKQNVRHGSGSVNMSSVRKITTTGVISIELNNDTSHQRKFRRRRSCSIGSSNSDTDTPMTEPKRKEPGVPTARRFPKLIRAKDSDDSDSEADTKSAVQARAKDDAAKRTEYIAEPVYVTELRDNVGDMLLREEDIRPRIKRATTTDPHVLEVIRYIESNLRPFSQLSEKKKALEAGATSAPTLRIISPWLLATLDAVCTYFPESNLLHTLSLPYPFALLVHHRKELEAFKANNPQELSKDDLEERNKHIDCALALVQAEHGEELEIEDARLLRDPPATTFKNYWIHLKPGTMVYRSQHGVHSPYVVNSVTGGASDDRLDQYTISLWNLNYDGSTFGRCSETEFLRPFLGERVINSLPIYPVEYHKDIEGQIPMKERMIDRGRRFMDLTRRNYCNYNGQAMTSPRHTYTGRVMIDTALLPWEEVNEPAFTPTLLKAALEGSRKTRRRRYYSRSYGDDEDDTPQVTLVPAFEGWDSLTEESKLTPEQFFLCSYYVFGYVFAARKWVVLDVEKVVDRDYDPDLMEKLVISSENKQMIKAICRDYTIDHKDRSADIIPGKGDGQILLLHGRPGVGKTLTAECVAEFTQRPLLAITPGDIGTNPKEVEEALAKFFRLGELWGAILLLDEADVYLESRTESDLERNSLVSGGYISFSKLAIMLTKNDEVFLRALEYYQGILFLTTNRVGSFDEAFASRIHVSIHYGDLGAEGREKIWGNLFDDLESDRPEVRVEYSARSYVSEDSLLRSLEWNGRQIRNAFRTAVSLAEFEAAEIKLNRTPCKHCKQPGHTPEICWVKHPENKFKKVFIKHQHLKSVTEMSSRFRDYLKSTKDADEAKLAKLSHMRDDNFAEGQGRRATQEKAPRRLVS